MNADINMHEKPESSLIREAQQGLARFIEEFYVSKPNPDDRMIDIRDDGENGCASVIYFQDDFSARMIRVVAKDQLIVGVADDPLLDWFNGMPWELAVWITEKQSALQLHCAPIAMSNGEYSEVFAVQLPVTSNLISKARGITDAKLVRFQLQTNGAIKISGPVRQEFPVTDIS